jgi:hypothetical protein
LITNNNQKVQGGGFCWRNLFASFVRNEDLEAGARADLFLRVLTEMFLAVFSWINNLNLEGDRLALVYREGLNVAFEGFNCYLFQRHDDQKEFEKNMSALIIWLLVVIIVISKVMKVMMKAGAMAIGVEYYMSREVNSSDCSEGEFYGEVILLRWKKELHFRKSRLVNKKTLISVNQPDEQSTNNSILLSIISRGSSKSNMFYQIDQRHEHIGSEASSSSEDGSLRWQVSRPLG